MPPVIVTGRELADRLDMTYDNVMGMARRGRIPSIAIGGGRLVFNLARVVEALRAEQGATGNLEEVAAC